MTRACAQCASAISRQNRSGLCRVCLARRNAADPTANEKRRAAFLRRLEDPQYRAEHIARCIRNGKNISADARERRRQNGHMQADVLRACNAAMTADLRAENGRKRTETVLAWCPPEWRAKYKDLTKRGRKAGEAKRIVLDLIAGRAEPLGYAQQRMKLAWCPPERLDEYRKVAKAVGAAEARRIIEADMTPFERQLARVRMGARLVTKPVLRKADPTFTLGGNATGMI